MEIRKGVVLAPLSSTAIFPSSKLMGNKSILGWWTSLFFGLQVTETNYLKQKGEQIGRILGSPAENRARITTGQEWMLGLTCLRGPRKLSIILALH